MSLPSVGRGVPPRREAVKRGPAPTPSASPSPSFPPTSGRGSASLSTPTSRSPASPQPGAGMKGQMVNDLDQYHDEGSGKNPCKYVIPAGKTARFSGNYQEDEYSLAGDGKCQKLLFEGSEQVQSRRPNLNRFSLNQIASINRTLTSGSQKTPIASQKTCVENSLILTNDDTPISGSQKTPIASQKTCVENSLILTNDDTPISNSEETASPYPDGGESSVSWTRERSSTPTLTDLENTIHVDCRLDRLLRVAVDYALPEELGH